MAKFKTQLRKAKKYVREELENTKPVDPTDTMDKQLEALNVQQFMEEADVEYSKLKSEELYIGKYKALKYKLVHMYVSGQYTQKQIARMLNVTPRTISKWLRYPDIRKMVEEYQQEEDMLVTASLKALRMKSIEKAHEILEGDNEFVQSIMIRDILDRTGHKATEKKQVDVNVTYEQKLQQLMNTPLENKEVKADYVIDDKSDEQVNTEGDDNGE